MTVHTRFVSPPTAAATGSAERLVVGLESLRPEEAGLFGAKSVRLASALRNGLNVPSAFCISRRAFDELAAPEWASLVEAEAFEELRSAILDVPLAPALRDEMLAAADARIFPESLAAVRSSSTAEDLEDSSSAGVYRSELNVGSPDELIRAVRRCWASYWSDAAVHYRRSVGLRHADHGMAILVQAMVQPRFAGVAFTQDPVSGGRDAVIVEAVEGVGEALVDGVARPRSFRFDRSLEWRRGEADSPCVEAAKAAAQIALACERLAGVPQDVEWAVDGAGMALLLQARPIVPCASPGAESRAAPSGWQLVYEEPFSPFGCELAMQRFLKWCEALSAYYGVSVDPQVRSESGLISYRPLWRSPGPGVKLTMRAMTAIRCLRSRAIHARYVREQLPHTRRQLKRLEAEARAANSERELYQCLVRSIDCYLEQQVTGFAIGKVASVEAGLLNLLCRRWKASIGSVSAVDLLSGLENASSERELALDRLRSRIQEATEGRIADWDSLLAALRAMPGGSETLGELQAFEEQYGYVWADRYPRDPAWRLDRRAEAETLLRPRSGSDLGACNLDKGVRQARKHRDETVAHCRSALGRSWRRRLFDVALRRAERDFPHREGRNEIVYRGAALIRLVMNRLGRRLADRGSLRFPDDIFFLQLAELRAVVQEPGLKPSMAAAIRARRREYEQTLRRSRRLGAIPRAPGSEARDLEHVKLSGDACSPGIAAGPARLISGLGEFWRVRSGDVVICRQLRPAWTTLFSRIAGAAIEQGGVLSHGSILAREYGIPVVINTPGLCERIREGDWVIIDGLKGTISARRAAPAARGDGSRPVGGEDV